MKGAVPPLVTTLATPVLSPKQATFTTMIESITGPALSNTGRLIMKVHPFASVIATKYGSRASSPVTVSVVAEVGLSQRNEYGGVPPEG